MKRWLLVPLLLPLAAALAVALLNLRVPARLRLLIWTSPPLPLGTWVLIAAGGGAAAAALAGLSAPGAPRASRNPGMNRAGGAPAGPWIRQRNRWIPVRPSSRLRRQNQRPRPHQNAHPMRLPQPWRCPFGLCSARPVLQPRPAVLMIGTMLLTMTGE